jgi:hypothetical protein
MRHTALRASTAAVAAALFSFLTVHHACAQDAEGWDGKRRISYQQQKDLFYNYYAQPGPFGGAGAELYVAPRPVPPFVGHTWVTYQPFYPHEFLYRHKRAYYTYNPGAGWRRTNVRYGTFGQGFHNCAADLVYPRSNNIWALHNDFHYPGIRW